jgi:alanine dehydrogenase
VTLLLTRADVAALLTLEDCIVAVEGAFRLLGDGKVQPPAIAGVHVDGGGFHVKAAALGNRFAAKINSNFFAAVPRIKGAIALFSADDGQLLAVLDSTEITVLRTGAATAVAAGRLARQDAKSVLVIGCGIQGRVQLRALKAVRKIKRVFALDSNAAVARAFAAETGAEIVSTPVAADVVITCTPSKTAILHAVADGTFVAAVGADSHEKQELAPELLRSAKVVTDITEQCATIGDLHHAIGAGVMARSDVHAELGAIVAGHKPGRTSSDEIFVFDSTGMALQDVAAASLAYERAVPAERGVRFDFA